MPTVDEAYPSRYAQPAKYLGMRMQLCIRAVTYEDGDYGPRYYLELDELDGRPWSDGQLAGIPPGQAKILGFAFGPAPEGWAGHVIELSTQQGRVKSGETKAWWCVMPLHQQPRVNPAPPPPSPRPEPPAANTRLRQAPSSAPGNGQAETDDLAAILDDEIPSFDPPAPAAAAAPQGKGRRPGRPRKEVR
jgi:hypothetical protein